MRVKCSECGVCIRDVRERIRNPGYLCHRKTLLRLKTSKHILLCNKCFTARNSKKIILDKKVF